VISFNPAINEANDKKKYQRLVGLKITLPLTNTSIIPSPIKIQPNSPNVRRKNNSDIIPAVIARTQPVADMSLHQ